MPREPDTDIVYSSERGRMCPRCELPIAECTCRGTARAASSTAGGGGGVRVWHETKGRRGKIVTAVSGIPLPPRELEALARELKRRCATGGCLKNGVLEIQGDHCQLLIDELRARGYQVKRAGG